MTNLLFYSDIIIENSIDNHDADSISVYTIASKVFNIVHGINRSHEEKLSVDFIKDDKQFIIRLFSLDKSWLNDMVNDMKKNFIIRDYTQIALPARTPKTDKYVINRRKQVHDKQSVVREKSLTYCNRLLRFHFVSKSNANPYILSIQQEEKHELIGNITPNNYGLSTFDKQFSLPRF